jgi:hypothetical protein
MAVLLKKTILLTIFRIFVLSWKWSRYANISIEAMNDVDDFIDQNLRPEDFNEFMNINRILIYAILLHLLELAIS